jgi:hypothetical protein
MAADEPSAAGDQHSHAVFFPAYPNFTSCVRHIGGQNRLMMISHWELSRRGARPLVRAIPLIISPQDNEG